MDSFNLFVKGIILGLSLAAPVGPINILCIRKTLQYGRWSGLCTGLGAAVADAFYGMVAAFGLTAISNTLIRAQFGLNFIGGIFLLYLGAKTFVAKPAQDALEIKKSSLLNDFVSTFFLTIVNPMTILSFVAMFAGLGLVGSSVNYANATLLVLGVFLGSASWSVVLNETITLFRKRISQEILVFINKTAGIIIAGFGMFSLSHLFH